MTKVAIATLQSASPYSQSRPHITPKLNKELPAEYEARTWREKMHVNKEGFVYIPGQSFANCIQEAAKYLSVKIPGQNQATYTKNFGAGLYVLEPLVLPIKQEDVRGENFFLNSDGKSGGNKRVWKTFPMIDSWQGDVTFQIVDDILTEDIFLRHLQQAGQLIGIGRWRPRNRGTNGRFKVLALQWKEFTAEDVKVS